MVDMLASDCLQYEVNKAREKIKNDFWRLGTGSFQAPLKQLLVQYLEHRAI